jgi:hypothetical protein
VVDRQGVERTLIYDPGQDAASRFGDWVIRHHANLGVPEVMCPVRKVILIERDDSRAGRRCSLAHAIAHIDLEHQASAGLTRWQEAAADRLACRRLIRIRHLVDAWRWSETFAEAAHELDVEPRFLELRLRHLHPAERHFLQRAIAEKEQWA